MSFGCLALDVTLNNRYLTCQRKDQRRKYNEWPGESMKRRGYWGRKKKEKEDKEKCH